MLETFNYFDTVVLYILHGGKLLTFAPKNFQCSIILDCTIIYSY